jgi:hypothetical protein
MYTYHNQAANHYVAGFDATANLRYRIGGGVEITVLRPVLHGGYTNAFLTAMCIHYAEEDAGNGYAAPLWVDAFTTMHYHTCNMGSYSAL